MTDEQIEAMLDELLIEVDYDAYKYCFVDGYVAEIDGGKAEQDRYRTALVNIVKKHLNKEGENNG